LGYIHRDLKPDNIILNLNPLEVRVIDFDHAFLDSTNTLGTAMGTPGYTPFADKWRDGSKRWDVWALAAMVLEADMGKDGYYRTKGEDDTIKKLEIHIKKPSTCIKLIELMN
jgi:serine/threonine protein kinase